MCCGCVCVCLGIELGQSSAGQGIRLPAAQTRSGPINRDEKAQLLLRFITYLCTCSVDPVQSELDLPSSQPDCISGKAAAIVDKRNNCF